MSLPESSSLFCIWQTPLPFMTHLKSHLFPKPSLILEQRHAYLCPNNLTALLWHLTSLTVIVYMFTSLMGLNIQSEKNLSCLKDL